MHRARFPRRGRGPRNRRRARFRFGQGALSHFARAIVRIAVELTMPMAIWRHCDSDHGGAQHTPSAPTAGSPERRSLSGRRIARRMARPSPALLVEQFGSKRSVPLAGNVKAGERLIRPSEQKRQTVARGDRPTQSGGGNATARMALAVYLRASTVAAVLAGHYSRRGLLRLSGDRADTTKTPSS